MMMTEVAGGISEAGSPGTTKGKAFNNLMRHQQRPSSPPDSDVGGMTSYNNNNNNLEMEQVTSPRITFNRSHHELEKVEAMVLPVEEANQDNTSSKGEEGERRQSSGENSPAGERTLSKGEDLSPGKLESSGGQPQQFVEMQEGDQGHGGDDEEGMMILDEEEFSEEEGGAEGEMIPGEEADEDSDRDEHRITVREALLSRAYQAAAAKYGHGGSKYSSSQGGRVSSGSGGTSSPSSGGGMNGNSRPHGGHHHHSHYHHQRDHTHRDHSHLNLNPGSRHGYHTSSHSHPLSRHPPYLTTETDNFIKSERRSHPSSPVNNCDLKPESLGVGSDIGSNGLGNALLSLASLQSLGGLAALQQSLPNFISNMGHNAPLNLTHHPRDLAAHISSQQQCRTSPNGNGHPLTSSGAGNMSPNSLIANAIANITGGSGGSSLAQQQGSIPQLILASGQISQGIQGAQLLIPTSQGIMSQTVLTIPITQPGSPPSPSTPSQSQLSHHPHLTGHSLPPNPGGNKRTHHSTHHHQIPTGGIPTLPHPHSRSLHHPQSPSIAPTAATLQKQSRNRDSLSPDYPHDRARTLLGLGSHSHLVGQPLGGHIMPTIPEKLALDHHSSSSGGLNGVRNVHGKRERESSGGGGYNQGGPNCGSGTLCPPNSSPCSLGGSIHDHDSDKFSDTEDDQMVDGINLDEIKEFAKAFKLRRLSLGLTQTQVGQALSVTEGPAYSQSAICSALAWLAQTQSYPPSIHQQSMFEKLDITPKSAQKIKPVLERWMKEAEERYKNGHQNLNEFVGMEPSKKRKRRTSFTPQALEILNNHFERNTHPSGAEITTLAHQLGYEREVIRIWFCNKRQALKNTVRMMSKGSSPM